MVPTIVDLTQSIPGAPHIAWWELTVTEHRGFLDLNRRVPLAFQPAGEALAKMLEMIRGFWDRPLIIHSAYRCAELNAAVGGSTSSQHMRMEAADFHVVDVSLQEVFQRIQKARADLGFGQLILEGPDPSAGLASWVHVSLGYPYRTKERTGECLYFSTRTKRYTRV